MGMPRSTAIASLLAMLMLSGCAKAQPSGNEPSLSLVREIAPPNVVS